MDVSLATSSGDTEQTSFEHVKCHHRSRKLLFWRREELNQ